MTKQSELKEKEVREHILKTKQEWNDHLENKEINSILDLAWQDPEKKAKADQILTWMNEALGDEMLDDDKESALERYKQLYNNWNENQENYDGKLDFGGALLRLKTLLEEWENPPKPDLIPEQQQKLDNYDKLEKDVEELKKDNTRIRDRELNDNEKKVITSFRSEIPQSGLSGRLMATKRMLENLKKNDLSVQANPNLSVQGISLPKKLASSFEQIVWICEFYFQMEKKLNQTIQDLEDQIQELEG